MTPVFNFIQLANLIYILKNELLEVNDDIDHQKFIKIMQKQKKYLKLFTEVLEKKKKLVGIQKNFLKNISNIKKKLDIEE